MIATNTRGILLKATCKNSSNYDEIKVQKIHRPDEILVFDEFFFTIQAKMWIFVIFNSFRFLKILLFLKSFVLPEWTLIKSD